jgi:L-alanine-DL-glutamate epimerase-like enolase superfamily enzyme
MGPGIRRVAGVRVYLLPLRYRMPLQFGREVVREVTAVRVALRVEGEAGAAEGWGETPLAVEWAWPSRDLGYGERQRVLLDVVARLAEAWLGQGGGHALEVGHRFLQEALPAVWAGFRGAGLPWLAALVACSPFDLALHDAYGRLVGRPVYETYRPPFLAQDLSAYLEPAPGAPVDFRGRYPADYLVPQPPRRLVAWHLVGGLDPLEPGDPAETPEDGHPVFLRDWIRRDGLRCLKVKLRGTDAAWDLERLARVGAVALEEGCLWLSADFNGTVTDPSYVTGVLERLLREHPRVFGMLLYVEQPFPPDLEAHPVDGHAVSALKPLFLDEAAHDWRAVRRGRELGWTGVALKTCKTQTGALLALAWARAHGMAIMVQDLTNPMLAQIPHVLLAAHAGTLMGVETNAMQFYPDASEPEARVHPGLYRRRGGELDLGTLGGPGFGYRLEEMPRRLPDPWLALA